jgi:stage II sporulation protein D
LRARTRAIAGTAAALAGVLLAGSIEPPPARADDVGRERVTVPSPEPSIRVLLIDGEKSVRVREPGRKPTAVRARGAGLEVGGRGVGPVWRREAGVLEVDGLRVRGGIEVRRSGDGLQVVNRVPLEDYVAGTLGREIYPGWAPETLKAQAVATRTYALHHARKSRRAPYDVEATTRFQVYGGQAAESESVLEATRATRDEVLIWHGEPILAVFHSSSGGRTASSEEVWGRALPYLVSRPVENEEDSPDTYWRTTVSGTKLGRALAPLGFRVGPVRELRVADRSASGRVRTVRVLGRDGETTIEARDLRGALGAKVIRSTMFETKKTPDGLVIVGSGHGHGVGMSQWGAEAMARHGAGYREILARFYPGTHLEKGVAR